MLQSSGRNRLAGAGLALLLFAAVATGAWFSWGGPGLRAQRLLAEARTSRSRGDDVEGERLAAAALALDRSSGAAALLAAECAASLREANRAIQYLQSATSAEPNFR